ncbi:alpha/beta hydrolase [Bacillus sp. FJAT-26390]|uniref:alpha/beta hydrolase n=1 Tax=Bacillus sp. FJAT-26390 TaxID=1743142 RepID=UPI000807D1CB|nr:alpha/beta hydrolase [Bacillus sp. FJAT-26390]OBZ10251.1 thioesterase [Bacillus sp. FJAT-26390]
MSLTYNKSESYWKQYQRFFPAEIQVDEDHLPTEEWWGWRDISIHLDRMPAADAKLKIISIHGAGGNGRLLAPYARLLQNHGYEVVSPDLPPYGLSEAATVKHIDYRLWIDILTALVEHETARDGKPIVLLGSSIGGMLAYNTAAMSKHVKGLIATTFIDTSRAEVRDQLAPNRFVSRVGKLSMDAFPFLADPFRISIKHVSRMHLISNHPELTKLIMNDTRAGGAKIPLRLLRTFLNTEPLIKPEQFDRCPVLLVHPEIDPMTPIQFSEPFYEKLTGDKQCVILEGAGHFPIEQPGLEQLKTAVLAFLRKLERTC